MDNLRRLESLKREKDRLYEEIKSRLSPGRLNEMDQLMEGLKDHHTQKVDTRLTKKLITLNGGPVRNLKHTNSFINLSDVTLTEDQIEFLNLGLKCSYIRKPHPESKRINTEILIDKLLHLHCQRKVTLSPTVVHDLVEESKVDRNHYHTKVLTKRLKAAAKSLRDNNSIIIRRADKSSVYVIMNKDQYFEKMDGILNDESKFQRLAADPTETLKSRISGLY